MKRRNAALWLSLRSCPEVSWHEPQFKKLLKMFMICIFDKFINYPNRQNKKNTQGPNLRLLTIHSQLTRLHLQVVAHGRANPGDGSATGSLWRRASSRLIDWVDTTVSLSLASPQGPPTRGNCPSQAVCLESFRCTNPATAISLQFKEGSVQLCCKGHTNLRRPTRISTSIWPSFLPDHSELLQACCSTVCWVHLARLGLGGLRISLGCLNVWMSLRLKCFSLCTLATLCVPNSQNSKT